MGHLDRSEDRLRTTAHGAPAFWRLVADRLDYSVGAERIAPVALDIEAELDHVAVVHNVVLAFHPHLARGFRRVHRTCLNQVVK